MKETDLYTGAKYFIEICINTKTESAKEVKSKRNVAGDEDGGR